MGPLPGFVPKGGIVIRLVAFDVDGTLTDGGIIVGGDSEEWKRFDAQDGMGLSLLRKSGVVLAFISGRFSPATCRRADALGVEHCFNGVEEKLLVLQGLAEKLNVSSEEVAFVGDDVNDLDCISWAGLGIAVQNAVDEVKAVADMVTSRSGGFGAAREVADYVLELNKAQGEDGA